MLNITRFRMGKQKRHLFQCSAWIFAGLLFASTLSAQFGTQALPDQDIGRPTQAPFITFLGIVMPGKLVTDPSLPPVGPVAQTLYQELRAYETPAGPAGEVMTAITSTWDEAGHAIEEIQKDGGSETDTSIATMELDSSVRNQYFRTASSHCPNSGIIGCTKNLAS